MKLQVRWRAIPPALLLALLIAAGCSPDETTSGPEGTVVSGTNVPKVNEVEAYASVTITEEDRNRISRIDVIPSHALVPAGGTVAFFAVAYDESGNALDPNETETRWSMADPQAGTITRTGVFHGGVQQGVFNDSIEVTTSQVVDGSLVTLQTLASVSILRSLRTWTSVAFKYCLKRYSYSRPPKWSWLPWLWTGQVSLSKELT